LLSPNRILYSEAPDPEASGSGAARQFEGRLLRTDDAEILDIVAAGRDDFQIAAHMWARIWTGDRELRWAWLDSDWLKEHARTKLATQEPDGRMIITSLPDALRLFLAQYGSDELAHGKQQVWSRLR